MLVHRLDRSHQQQHDRISIEQNQPNPPLVMSHEPSVGYYQPMAAPMRWPTVVPMEAQLIENMRQMSLSMPMQPYSSWAQPEPWNRTFCLKIRGLTKAKMAEEEIAQVAESMTTDFLPATRSDPRACLFVASYFDIFKVFIFTLIRLASSRTDDQLTESVTKHFRRYGPLVSVKVLKDWANRPYAFVQFEHLEDAKRAMVCLLESKAYMPG
jgi:hypothetical protein